MVDLGLIERTERGGLVYPFDDIRHSCGRALEAAAQPKPCFKSSAGHDPALCCPAGVNFSFGSKLKPFEPPTNTGQVTSSKTLILILSQDIL